MRTKSYDDSAYDRRRIILQRLRIFSLFFMLPSSLSAGINPE